MNNAAVRGILTRPEARRGPGKGALALATLVLCALLISCASTPSATASRQAREWFAIGNVWADKSEWVKAGQAWSQAIDLDPSLAAATYNLVRGLTEAGDYPNAIVAADKLLASDSANIRVLSLKAYAQSKSGDDAAALATYGVVIALNPNSPDAVYNSALLKSRAGKKAEALADIRRLSEAMPEDIQALKLYAKLTDETGKAPEAITLYEKLKKLGKADSGQLERLGFLYEANKNYADAITAYAASTALPGATANAWFSLARLRLSVAGDGTNGLTALDRAIAAGFKDKDACRALLLLPVLAQREAVSARLKKAGLVL